MRRIRNPVYGFYRTVGSNPTLSAKTSQITGQMGDRSSRPPDRTPFGGAPPGEVQRMRLDRPRNRVTETRERRYTLGRRFACRLMTHRLKRLYGSRSLAAESRCGIDLRPSRLRPATATHVARCGQFGSQHLSRTKEAKQVVLPPVERTALMASLHQFDATLRETPDWLDWESKPAQRFALVHNEFQYPPKKIISMATGVPVSMFSGGHQSNEYLRQRGFEVVPIKRYESGPLRAPRFVIGKVYDRWPDINEPYGGSRQSGISSSSRTPAIFPSRAHHAHRTVVAHADLR